ncbi:MAG: pitrilysin family protein [Pirellulales bacterium]
MTPASGRRSAGRERRPCPGSRTGPILEPRESPLPIHSHTFHNGLTLLAEPMPWLESVALAILVPGGCARDPVDRLGMASLAAELMQRGSGQRDSRQFLEDLERLGVDTSNSVAAQHASFSGAMPAESLPAALSIFADLVRRPHLAEDQFEDAQQSCLQEVLAIEDDLSTRALHRLRARHYPDPWGRASQGSIAGLEAATLDEVRRHWEATYVPRGAILSIAGKFEWPVLQAQVEAALGDWQGAEPLPIVAAPAVGGCEHIEHDSAQTQIWLAYDSVPYSHPDFYEARAAIGVLSDGMSSRLFTEVREKRGLSYAVSAFCHSLLDRGAVFGYAGTSTERAQETLDVLVEEFVKLQAGVTEEELVRLKVGLKSSLIMQQESSASRCGVMALDWYHLGRVRSAEELGAIVDGLNVSAINAYLAAHPPRDFTVVTLGAKPLDLSCLKPTRG